MEYNTRNILLENTQNTQNFVEKLFPESFLKIQNCAMSGSIVKSLYSLLLLKHFESKPQTTCF